MKLSLNLRAAANEVESNDFTILINESSKSTWANIAPITPNQTGAAKANRPGSCREKHSNNEINSRDYAK